MITITTNDYTAFNEKYVVRLEYLDGAIKGDIAVNTYDMRNRVSATVSSKGSIDVLRSGSKITITPSFKNCNSTKNLQVDYVVDEYEGRYDYYDATDYFDIVSGTQGAVYVKLADDAFINRANKYELSIMVGGNIVAKKQLSIIQGSVKFAQDVKALTLYKADKYDEKVVTITVPDVSVNRIARVVIKNEDKSFLRIRELDNGKYAIGFKNYSTRSIGNKANETVKLDIFIEGNETAKPDGTISVNVLFK